MKKTVESSVYDYKTGINRKEFNWESKNFKDILIL